VQLVVSEEKSANLFPFKLLLYLTVISYCPSHSFSLTTISYFLLCPQNFNNSSWSKTSAYNLVHMLTKKWSYQIRIAASVLHTLSYLLLLCVSFLSTMLYVISTLASAYALDPIFCYLLMNIALGERQGWLSQAYSQSYGLCLLCGFNLHLYEAMMLSSFSCAYLPLHI
jgi:hypothetical protein